MTAIDIFVPAEDVRRVHVVIAERLSDRGYDVALVGVDTPGMSRVLSNLLSLERKFLRIRANSLLKPAESISLSTARPAARLRIDLTGGAANAGSPVLSPVFAGHACLGRAAQLLMLGALPEVEIALDGRHRIAHAAPMIDSRLSIVRGLNDMSARMATLLVDRADRHLKGEMPQHRPVETVVNAACPTSAQMVGAYVFSTMPRQAGGTMRRLRSRLHRWRVSYRFHKGNRVADTGLLAGEPWMTLPDDGKRFYADPFPFEWQGRHFIFVEEFPNNASKALISVAEIAGDGTPSVPKPILEKPHHLSYPNVFSHNGQVWMLPEQGSCGNLVLYRAEAFPDRWVEHSVIIPDRELFDATLLEHGGRLWLFATERDGYGSSSDTLVVYHASSLEGPWTPHPGNPVRIDRAAARPGGQFIRVGERVVLPLQDGTDGYGGGLGLADLVELDERTVHLTRPVPILSSAKAPYPKIHTLNSSEHLEVIDCLDPMSRIGFRRSA